MQRLIYSIIHSVDCTQYLSLGTILDGAVEFLIYQPENMQPSCTLLFQQIQNLLSVTALCSCRYRHTKSSQKERERVWGREGRTAQCHRSLRNEHKVRNLNCVADVQPPLPPLIVFLKNSKTFSAVYHTSAVPVQNGHFSKRADCLASGIAACF